MDTETNTRLLAPRFNGVALPSAPGECATEAHCQRLLNRLTPRQNEVFHWICEGKRDREIATILGISYRTVTVHVRAILAKLGVENRTCAAMMGARTGVASGDRAISIQNTLLYVPLVVCDLLWDACRHANQFTMTNSTSLFNWLG